MDAVNDLFGTDGIRGRSGDFPLDEESLLKIGNIICSGLGARRILIARDNRVSGPEIEETLCRGLHEAREIVLAGVLPSPALACLTRRQGFDLGIMITASHNPWQDNGLKFFDSSGKKLDSETEKKLGSLFYGIERGHTGNPTIKRMDLTSAYIEFLRLVFKNNPISNRSLVIDCANGAAAKLIKQLSSAFDLNWKIIHAEADGHKINLDCGATAPASLQAAVKARPGAIGAAFDGDGDRVIFVDEAGNLLDGDHTLWILARNLAAREKNFNPVVVGTIMSNSGLEKALREIGLTLARAGVGDRQVMRLMESKQAILGGEPSGHTILGHLHTTGDGMLTLLFLLRALQENGRDLAAAANSLNMLPQLKSDIATIERFDFNQWPAFVESQKKIEGNGGRLVVRYSGTENKLRIMIEHPDREKAAHCLDNLLDIFAKGKGDIQ